MGRRAAWATFGVLGSALIDACAATTPRCSGSPEGELRSAALTVQIKSGTPRNAQTRTVVAARASGE